MKQRYATSFSFFLFLFIGIGLWLYTEVAQTYLYYYREHLQLFLWDIDFLHERYWTVGGFAMLAAQALVQFFYIPCLGSGVTVCGVLLLAILLWQVLRQVQTAQWLMPLCLLPGLFQLYCLDNHYYYYQGFTAFCFMLLLLWGYVRWTEKQQVVMRLVIGMMTSAVAYLLLGAVGVWLAVLLLFYDLFTGKKFWYGQGCSLLAVLLLGYILTRMGKVESLRLIWSVDGYYEPGLQPTGLYYLPWIMTLSLFPLFALSRYLPTFSTKVEMGGGIVILAVVLCFHGVKVRSARVSLYPLMALQHATEIEDWDAVLQSPYAKRSNLLTTNYVNLALSHRGELLTRLFEFPQQSPLSLLVQNKQGERSPELAMLAAEVYYQMGNIGAAQNKAFDAVVSVRYGTPSMYKLLVKTNLIFGYHAVAEKYLNLLERTVHYRDWALQYRKYLYHEEAVLADSELGDKRRSLIEKDVFAMEYGPYVDLMHVLEANPTNREARDYAIAFLILAKDRKNMDRFVEQYMGTPVMEEVPVLLQQALALFHEDDPDFCLSHGVGEEVLSAFQLFRTQYQASRGKANAPQTLYREYGHTAWFYILFNELKQ